MSYSTSSGVAALAIEYVRMQQVKLGKPRLELYLRYPTK